MEFLIGLEFMFMLIAGGCLDSENPTNAIIAFVISLIALEITTFIKEKKDACRPKHRRPSK